jgi:hypothetical protein
MNIILIGSIPPTPQRSHHLSHSLFWSFSHLDNKHSDTLPSNATICLADYCPIFGCSSKSRSTDEPSFHHLVFCKDEEMEKYSYQCENLARNCFSSQSENQIMYQQFRTQICGSLHCENGILKVTSLTFLLVSFSINSVPT